MTGEVLLLVSSLAAAGVFAGFVGGLFGVGGGIVLVPVLYHLFGVLEVDEAVRMHVSVATSLSTIIATSWRSMTTHARVGAVDITLLRAWTPWIAFGAACGSALASVLSGETLLVVFGIGMLAIAANIGLSRESWRLAADVPTGTPRALIAGAIGALSALMGIGGGTFGVAVMTLSGRPIHQAVATASGFGAAIAAPAVLVNIATGWAHGGRPPLSLGFVNVPGFALLAALTMIAAPYGARLAHRLDRTMLKRAFAAFLAVTALNLFYEAAR